MSAATKNVVILDDHAMMREFLRSRLESQPDTTEVVYSGDSIHEAKPTLSSADCVILDLDLGDGVSAEENLASLSEFNVPVLVVSAATSARSVQSALASGAQGYVSKQAQPEEFDRAMDAMFTGKPYVSPDLGSKLAISVTSDVKLSAQEKRAMTLYASGMKLEAVAETMGIGVGTVKEYIRRVRGKYAAAGVSLPSKVDLYRKAQEEGML